MTIFITFRNPLKVVANILPPGLEAGVRLPDWKGQGKCVTAGQPVAVEINQYKAGTKFFCQNNELGQVSAEGEGGGSF